MEFIITEQIQTQEQIKDKAKFTKSMSSQSDGWESALVGQTKHSYCPHLFDWVIKISNNLRVQVYPWHSSFLPQGETNIRLYAFLFAGKINKGKMFIYLITT